MHGRISLLFFLTFIYSLELIGQVYNKQHTYLDALELDNIYKEYRKPGWMDNSSIVESYYDILRKYGITPDNIGSNIFLKNFTPATQVVSGCCSPADQSRVAWYKEVVEEPGNAMPVNWQASAINGMANFMAGRFKQEMLSVALDQMFKQIKTEKDSALFSAVFPNTFKYIKKIYGSGSSAYYTADLLLLRQTVQIDFEQLPDNLQKNQVLIFPALKNEPKVRDMIALAGYIVEYGRQGQALDELLSSLASETYSSDSTIYKVLNVADLFSQALLDEEGSDKIWVNPFTLLPVHASSNDDLKIRFFYGLLYQQLIQIPEFKEYLHSQVEGDVVIVAVKIQKLLRFVNKLNGLYESMKTKKFQLNTTEDIIVYLKEINESLMLFTANIKEIPEVNNFYKLKEETLLASEKYIRVVEALWQKDYQKVIPLVLIEFSNYITIDDKSSRVLIFLSQLSAVETAADMEALLNSYALPIGSSSIKRRSSFNLSVNGYVGFTGGWETAYGSQQNQTRGNIGLTAPIGVSATFAKGVVTPFISIFDLGSIVNQRLQNDTTSYSDLRLEQFFTPGIGLFFNFRKLPLSTGVHFNYIPNLRTIKYDSGNATITETSRSVTRLNFSVLIDIPFFTLYNKERD